MSAFLFDWDFGGIAVPCGLSSVPLSLIEVTESLRYPAVSERISRLLCSSWPDELPPVFAYKSDNAYTLLDGHHRLFAAEKNCFRGVPVLWAEPDDEAQDEIMRLDMDRLEVEAAVVRAIPQQFPWMGFVDVTLSGKKPSVSCAHE